MAEPFSCKWLSAMMTILPLHFIHSPKLEERLIALMILSAYLDIISSIETDDHDVII